MANETSEIVKRIQSIVTTLDQKKADVERIRSDMNRLNIILGKSLEALQQARRQLVVELAKLDPEGFEWVNGKVPVGPPVGACVGVPS